MATEVKVPTLGESITEGDRRQWLKQPGDAVAVDEPIASLETDKVSVEVPSPVAGVLAEHGRQGGRHGRGRRADRGDRGAASGAAAGGSARAAAGRCRSRRCRRTAAARSRAQPTLRRRSSRAAARR